MSLLLAVSLFGAPCVACCIEAKPQAAEPSHDCCPTKPAGSPTKKQCEGHQHEQAVKDQSVDKIFAAPAVVELPTAVSEAESTRSFPEFSASPVSPTPAYLAFHTLRI